LAIEKSGEAGGGGGVWRGYAPKTKWQLGGCPNRQTLMGELFFVAAESRMYTDGGTGIFGQPLNP